MTIRGTSGSVRIILSMSTRAISVGLRSTAVSCHSTLATAGSCLHLKSHEQLPPLEELKLGQKRHVLSVKIVRSRCSSLLPLGQWKVAAVP